MNQNRGNSPAMYLHYRHSSRAYPGSFALVFLGLAIATSSAPTVAAPLNLSATQTVAQSTPKPDQPQEFPDSCRRTSVQVPIGVRQQPSFTSPSVGTLTRGTRVNIVNLGSNGWVPINAPYQGFVYAGYLTYCGDRFIVPEALLNPDNSVPASQATPTP